MNADRIKDLIDFIAQTGLEEVNIETEEIKLSVKKSPPAPSNTTSVAAEGEISAAANSVDGMSATHPDYVTIKSPMIGTFYHASDPQASPFVQVGERVTQGQTLCVIEAMKLFNEIESEVAGTVVQVLVEDASPVEYDQPLFWIAPDEGEGEDGK